MDEPGGGAKQFEGRAQEMVELGRRTCKMRNPLHLTRRKFRIPQGNKAKYRMKTILKQRSTAQKIVLTPCR